MDWPCNGTRGLSNHVRQVLFLPYVPCGLGSKVPPPDESHTHRTTGVPGSIRVCLWFIYRSRSSFRRTYGPRVSVTGRTGSPSFPAVNNLFRGPTEHKKVIGVQEVLSW